MYFTCLVKILGWVVVSASVGRQVKTEVKMAGKKGERAVGKI